MKKKFVARLWLIIIAAFTVLNIVVFQFIKTFYEKRGYDYFLSSNLNNASDLQGRIVSYNSLIELPPLVNINDYMVNLETTYGTTFDEIYYVVNSNLEVTSDGKLFNPFIASEFVQPGITVEKESTLFQNSTLDYANIYFKHQYSIFTFVFTKKLADFLISDDVIIFKDDGALIYSKVDYGSQYYTLLENGNSVSFVNDFRDKLRAEQSIVVNGNILSHQNVIAASEFSQEDFSNRFYLANFTLNTVFVTTYLPLFYLTIAESLVYAVLVLFVVIYASNSASRSNDDYTEDLKTFSDSNVFYLSFNGKGKLKNYNRTFAARVRNYREIKRIENFISIDDKHLAMEDIQKINIINLKFKGINNDTIIVRGTVLRKHDYIMIFGEDVTKTFLSSDRVRRLAFIHPITKIVNLHSLEDEVDTLIKDNKDFTMIAFDVQNFRSINKLFGRNNGDIILLEIAERLKTVFPHLFHIEGDLFIALLNFKTNRDDIENTYRDVISSFKRPLFVNDNKFEIDFRLGVFTKDGRTDFKTSYENLMQALKTAKGNTAQKYVVYDVNIGQKFSREVMLEHHLRNALDKNEFEVFFQPQYNMDTNKIVAFETLIRWRNPNYEGESPQLFIELAEKNNMIIKIGRFVLEEALKVAKVLEPFGIKISINVSPLQIFQSGYVQEATAMLEKYNLEKQTIALELTETFVMESFGEIINKLNSLKENGFALHLDDFGEGYSSFAYLKNLPADAIKISYNFTKDIVTNKSSALIVKEMISLAKNFEKEVICEGIETEAHAKLVARFGCHIIQGFWISRAVRFDEAKILLKKHNNIDV